MNRSAMSDYNQNQDRQFRVNGCSDYIPPAIRISPFVGHDDCISALDWINLYDMITSDYKYSSENKLNRIGGYLRDYALRWHVFTLSHYGIKTLTWDSFKGLFIERFTIMAPLYTSSECSPTRLDFDET